MFLAITESDALALAMLTMIMVSFGVILTLLACMVRSSNRRDEQVDHLIDELEKDRKKVSPNKELNSPKLEAWEREGDWWKE
ncbi:MAG: hypothetical protein AB8D78_12220 [Akkermansiaceae bacterium]